jgi:two-component system response regulator HydG
MDIKMKEMDGIEALKQIKQLSPQIPIVMMTAFSSVDTAVDALKSGASDYLTKPIDIEEVKIIVKKTIKYRRLEQENKYLRERIDDRFDFSEIIGRSPAMKRVFETVSLVAPTQATALITGESGTGKELIANAIHQNSPRKDKPFIKINCAALAESLLESELFGHEKGSFTGAQRQKRGKFQMAHQGSIFLDEIGEMSLGTQAKILRVLQEQEFEMVGGTNSIKVDVRVIAATNRVLESDIANGRFREDLYYRLNVVQIEMPPLCSRREDIPLLAERFLKIYSKKNQRFLKGFSPRAIDLIMRYSWPGNVRELENLVERAVILARSEVIMPEEFPEKIRQEGKPPHTEESGFRVGRTLKAVERDMILKTLEHTDGNRTHTAKMLGISRRTLQLKLKEYMAE